MHWLNPARIWSCRWLFLLLSLTSFGEAFPEYKVKAAYLYNFARFVEWPKSAFASSDAPLIVGIIGSDPFGESLDETFREKAIQGRSVQILRLVNDSGLEKVNLLFIGKSEKDRVAAILAKVEGVPVLTVSELDDFTKVGGMIQLRVTDQQVAFDLNQRATKKVGLIPSVQMIKIAKNVRY
jgi:hypothetical protein